MAKKQRINIPQVAKGCKRVFRKDAPVLTL
jgi:hypothetical protein